MLILWASLVIVQARTGWGEIPPAGTVPISGEAARELPQFEATPKHRSILLIPECFDARQKWAGCQSIGDIRHQGLCGTCWAVAAASVISDRICITSGQRNQTYVSAINLASCTVAGRSPQQNCIGGDDAANAYKQATLYGAVTGGNYQSSYGCQPYSLSPTDQLGLSCQKTCSNAGYDRPYDDDLIFVDTFWTTYSNTLSQEQNAANVHQMQMDIIANGPITAAITAFSDLETWTSDKGAYRGPSPEALNKAGHAIRIIGWCKDQQRVPYWLVANSWGTEKGDRGFFWIERGRNVIGIEDHISAPIIRQPNNCPSLCDQPLDQLIRLHPYDRQSPVYAFQGTCVTEVRVEGGRIVPVAAPAPIGTVLVGGPRAPVTHWAEAKNQGELWFIGPSGFASVCGDTPGSSKKSCRAGNVHPDATAGPQTLNMATRDKYVYYTDEARRQQIYQFMGGMYRPQAINIKDALANNFQKVTALLDLDGKSMLVCGVAKDGQGACGTLSYGSWKLTGQATMDKIVTQC
ncbi:tubulointerstitial nephritis antigen-like [Paramacrobiotus metropolitanus]|uniref:tubulointerstitial nephritis antigen-like n=1 Tax=Paramacrobiotus metropolitanus TaxID=2943436 RepID=UPI0024461550|nr:tubulointerstitial nephritis antigen-like [Paramacrobiotus metropolitanus]